VKAPFIALYLAPVNMPTILAQPETLTLATVREVFNLRGLYILGYAWLFGMCKYLIYTISNRGTKLRIAEQRFG
jgi:hypothetical protein